MTALELSADLVRTFGKMTREAVMGLSQDQLSWRPDAQGNGIGVTVWHCSRGLDVLNETPGRRAFRATIASSPLD
jgi:hypothetical protein